MTNSVNPDQTAPIGAVCSGPTLFASILKFVINVWQFFAADDFSTYVILLLSHQTMVHKDQGHLPELRTYLFTFLSDLFKYCKRRSSFDY